MHSVARTVKAGGMPLSKAIHISTTTNSSLALPLLQPSKALATLSSRSSSGRAGTQLVSYYYTTSAARAQNVTAPMMYTPRNLWTRHLYTSKSYSTSSTTAASTTEATTSGSALVQELEQLLAKNDYKTFQEACFKATSTPTGAAAPHMTKELYHFLLQTLGKKPQAFAPLTTSNTTGRDQTEVSALDSLDPLSSAIGILTDMNREAIVLGKTELQPDRDTLQLILQIAGNSGKGDWESARMLVEAVRHGRLPALLSLDQWELPDLDIPLDQNLWKSMFECIHSAAAGSRAAGVQKEMDVMTFLMADQLAKSQDVEMDEDLWGYILQAYGKAGSAAKLNDLLPRLPSIKKTADGKLYSIAAEALANCGLIDQAAEIMKTVSESFDILPSIRPFIALARQYAKRGNYEAIDADKSVWATKGQQQESTELLNDLHLSSLEAYAVALDRLIKTMTKTFKDRHSNVLPDSILAGMTTPAQMDSYQFTEVEYLWRKSRRAVEMIPMTDMTADNYDTLMRILTRLNLLLPKKFPLQGHAFDLLQSMKQNGVRPLKSTYMTLMETMARTREYRTSREGGLMTKKIMDVFVEMTSHGGYTIESPRDFLPMLESCFGVYAPSAFSAGQWMHSNQLYPVSKDALKMVEEMMRKTLAATASTTTSQEDNDKGNEINVQQYHDRDTIASVLAGLAFGDDIHEIWKRWDDLALNGVERDATLYQTVIGASQGQEAMARYVLRNIRYDIQKEYPPVAMTPEIFEGLLNCCIRTQDAISARSLISQYTVSGDIQKTAEWYAPMVRTCLTVEGMEKEGGFLLEEMIRNEMAMDTVKSGAFMEFLMDYFVNQRRDFTTGQSIFNTYIRGDQKMIEKLMAEAQAKKGNSKEIVEMSEAELTWRSNRWSQPTEHIVEKMVLSPTTAAMLNLLVLAKVREQTQMQPSDIHNGSMDRMRDTKFIIRYMAGMADKTHSPQPSMLAPPTIPQDATISAEMPTSSELSLLFKPTSKVVSPSKAADKTGASARRGMLQFIDKRVLGEYIDTCIRSGSPELLEDADWAVNQVMPRVIGSQRMAKDMQRWRQSIENIRGKVV
ncbi:hypothetical protein FBU30_004782 [Linnemannia zychae]|nr:hypothetical protein FBU30_004782 [Linnemannia zychae]